jgi:hypothetical protein
MMATAPKLLSRMASKPGTVILPAIVACRFVRKEISHDDQIELIGL